MVIRQDYVRKYRKMDTRQTYRKLVIVIYDKNKHMIVKEKVNYSYKHGNFLTHHYRRF